ncbi:MAG: hypothetical protein GX631_09900 [Dehalococcoidales bacterium]|jgi:hypothetical protein|nr:hypothetical protein [Dehalococcoidales bacterium]
MRRNSRHLDECLERLHNGESIDSCLRDYPEEAEELRPLLALASDVTLAAKNIEPSPEFISRTQLKLESAYHETFQRSTAEQKQVSPRRRAFQVAGFCFLLLVITFLGGSAVLAKAAENVMPGHFLYPIKLISEQVKLTLTFGEDKKMTRLASYAETRANEAAYVTASGDEAKAERSISMIEGYLDEINEILTSNVIITGDNDSLHFVESITRLESAQNALASIETPTVQPPAESGVTVTTANVTEQQPARAEQPSGTTENTTESTPPETAQPPKEAPAEASPSVSSAPAADVTPPLAKVKEELDTTKKNIEKAKEETEAAKEDKTEGNSQDKGKDQEKSQGPSNGKGNSDKEAEKTSLPDTDEKGKPDKGNQGKGFSDTSSGEFGSSGDDESKGKGTKK